MKFTVEAFENKYTAETPNDDMSLPDVLVILSGLLKQVGYSFNGELDIVDHSEG